MTKDEALKLALEALNRNDYLGWQTNIHVREAIREALAQPEQDPVWIQPNHLQKARQAPFLCRVEPKQRDDFVPMYTTPPQRKPLSDNEIRKLSGDSFGVNLLHFVRAIEAAHGIKGDA